VSANDLLTELAAGGIRLGRDGDALVADVLPGADLDPFRERIRQHRPALLTLLALQDEIVRAASVAQDAFSRRHYDELWAEWHALQAGQEMTS
jgi:hypothetical protein